MDVLLVFLEGILAFVSPCILPMLPVYLVYLAGGQSEANPRRRLTNTLGFVLGFSLIYVALGATATTVGRFLFTNKLLLQRLSGLILIVLGIYYIDIIRVPERWQIWKRIRKPAGGSTDRPDRTSGLTHEMNFGKSLLFGVAFTFTWTPCLTTWVGAALALAANSATVWHGIGLLFVFSLGLGLPFILTAMLYDRLQSGLTWIKRHYRQIRVVSGALLIITGLLMLTGVIDRYMALFG